MSDVFPGEGWWMASDGKWYAPQLHHDPAYRAKYASVMPEDEYAAPESDEVESGGSTIDASTDAESAPGADEGADVATMATASRWGADEPEVDVAPTEVEWPLDAVSGEGVVDELTDTAPDGAVLAEEVDWPAEPVEPDVVAETPASIPVSEILSRVRVDSGTGELADAAPTADVIDWPELPDGGEDTPEEMSEGDDWVSHGPLSDAADRPLHEIHEFSVASPDTVIDDVRAAEHVPPIVEVPEHDEAAHTRAQLEIGGATPLHGRSSPVPQAPPPAPEVVVPGGLQEIRIYRDPVDLRDRIVAGVLFLAGVAMIVGTFVDWIGGPSADTTGWERGDGIATVIAGILGSAAAGPVFVGFRHIVPKTIAIVSGLVGAVVMSLVGLDAVSDSDLAGTSVAAGFWVVLLGSLAMIGAGIAERTPIPR